MLRADDADTKRHRTNEDQEEYAVTGFDTSIDEMYVFSYYKFLIKPISFHIFIFSDTTSWRQGK